MNVNLTDAEVETLIDGLVVDIESVTAESRLPGDRLRAAVGLIVADREAAAWDLGYDEGQDDEARRVYPDIGRRLNPYRAAPAAADPADTTAPPWAGPVEALRAGRVRHGLPARPDPDSSEAPA